MPVHDDPTAQLFAEAYAVLLEEAPEPPSFEDLTAIGIGSRKRPLAKRHGWLVALAAAVATALLIGLIPLLLSQPEAPTVDDPVSPTVAPPTTAPRPPSTTTPPTTQAESETAFAPSLAATGLVGDPERSGFRVAIDQVGLEFDDLTFEVWELSWDVTWSRMLGWAINPDDPDQFRFPEMTYCTVLMPEESLIIRTSCRDRNIERAVGQFHYEFTGTDQSWSVELTDLDDGQPLGTITGSFPGLSEDEILRHLVEEGRIGWFFVVEEGASTQVEPPWYEYFQDGHDPHLVVVDGGLLAVPITRTLPLDQWTIFRTEDGRDWREIGPAPWSDAGPCPVSNEHTFLDTLVVHDGQLLALTSCEAQSWIDDGDVLVPGFFEVHYWSSPDGITWTEIDRDEWDTLTDGQLPNWCEEDDIGPSERAAACNP